MHSAASGETKRATTTTKVAGENARESREWDISFVLEFPVTSETLSPFFLRAALLGMTNSTRSCFDSVWEALRDKGSAAA